jgi:hypothetical protein
MLWAKVITSVQFHSQLDTASYKCFICLIKYWDLQNKPVYVTTGKRQINKDTI